MHPSQGLAARLRFSASAQPSTSLSQQYASFALMGFAPFLLPPRVPSFAQGHKKKGAKMFILAKMKAQLDADNVSQASPGYNCVDASFRAVM